MSVPVAQFYDDYFSSSWVSFSTDCCLDFVFYIPGIVWVGLSHDTSISSLYLYDSSLFCQFGALFLIDQVILVQHRPRISSRYGAEVEIGLCLRLFSCEYSWFFNLCRRQEVGLSLRLFQLRIFMMIIFSSSWVSFSIPALPLCFPSCGVFIYFFFCNLANGTCYRGGFQRGKS